MKKIIFDILSFSLLVFACACTKQAPHITTGTGQIIDGDGKGIAALLKSASDLDGAIASVGQLDDNALAAMLLDTSCEGYSATDCAAQAALPAKARDEAKDLAIAIVRQIREVEPSLRYELVSDQPKAQDENGNEILVNAIVDAQNPRVIKVSFPFAMSWYESFAKRVLVTWTIAHEWGHEILFNGKRVNDIEVRENFPGAGGGRKLVDAAALMVLRLWLLQLPKSACEVTAAKTSVSYLTEVGGTPQAPTTAVDFGLALGTGLDASMVTKIEVDGGSFVFDSGSLTGTSQIPNGGSHAIRATVTNPHNNVKSVCSQLVQTSPIAISTNTIYGFTLSIPGATYFLYRLFAEGPTGYQSQGPLVHALTVATPGCQTRLYQVLSDQSVGGYKVITAPSGDVNAFVGFVCPEAKPGSVVIYRMFNPASQAYTLAIGEQQRQNLLDDKWSDSATLGWGVPL